MQQSKSINAQDMTNHQLAADVRTCFAQLPERFTKCEQIQEMLKLNLNLHAEQSFKPKRRCK